MTISIFTQKLLCIYEAIHFDFSGDLAMNVTGLRAKIASRLFVLATRRSAQFTQRSQRRLSGFHPSGGKVDAHLPQINWPQTVQRRLTTGLRKKDPAKFSDTVRSGLMRWAVHWLPCVGG